MLLLQVALVGTLANLIVGDPTIVLQSHQFYLARGQPFFGPVPVVTVEHNPPHTPLTATSPLVTVASTLALNVTNVTTLASNITGNSTTASAPTTVQVSSSNNGTNANINSTATSPPPETTTSTLGSNFSFFCSDCYLPTGISLSESTGRVSGITNSIGIYFATVGAKDHASGLNETSIMRLDLIVLPSLSADVDNDTDVLELNVGQSMAWTPQVSFQTQSPFGVSFFTEGNLPNGLSLDASTGTISGTPTVAGQYGDLQLYASDGVSVVLVLELRDVAVSGQDCDFAQNGPNGRNCGQGVCLDTVPFDGSFACDCSSVPNARAPNCDVGGNGDGDGDDGDSPPNPKGQKGLTAAQTAGIAAGSCAAVLVVFAVLFIVARKWRDRNAKVGTGEVEESAASSFQYPPADEWEFPRDRLRLVGVLGKGQFGQVFLATAINIRESMGMVDVAVKTCGHLPDVSNSINGTGGLTASIGSSGATQRLAVRTTEDIVIPMTTSDEDSGQEDSGEGPEYEPLAPQATQVDEPDGPLNAELKSAADGKTYQSAVPQTANRSSARKRRVLFRSSSDSAAMRAKHQAQPHPWATSRDIAAFHASTLGKRNSAVLLRPTRVIDHEDDDAFDDGNDDATRLDKHAVIEMSTIGGSEDVDSDTDSLDSIPGPVADADAASVPPSATLQRRRPMTAGVLNRLVDVSDEAKRRFVVEAQAMKRFDHENVVRLLGVCMQESPLLIITEYMHNGDLHNFLRVHHEVTPIRLCRMAQDIARGLAYLHACNYIHGDLACRNCLVDKELNVKISDFGFAKDANFKGYYRRAAEDDIPLPVRWMAPESLSLGQITKASDVWSLGIVLWELMTHCEMPYPAMSNHEVFTRVCKGYRMKRPPLASSAIYKIMMACWEDSAEHRPSAQQVHDRLAICISNGQVSPTTTDGRPLKVIPPDQWPAVFGASTSPSSANGSGGASSKERQRIPLKDATSLQRRLKRLSSKGSISHKAPKPGIPADMFVRAQQRQLGDQGDGHATMADSPSTADSSHTTTKAIVRSLSSSGPAPSPTATRSKQTRQRRRHSAGPAFPALEETELEHDGSDGARSDSSERTDANHVTGAAGAPPKQQPHSQDTSHSGNVVADAAKAVEERRVKVPNRIDNSGDTDRAGRAASRPVSQQGSGGSYVPLSAMVPKDDQPLYFVPENEADKGCDSDQNPEAGRFFE